MLCITFDNFGCAATLPPCPFPEIVPVEEWRRYNEIGLTLGHPRILRLLEQLQISATFFAEGYSALLHPQEMKRWHESGHEIALHGWKHETWSELPSQQKEDQLVGLAVAAVTDLLGEAPIGFRPPGLHINPWTDEVMQRHGIAYIAQSVAYGDARSAVAPAIEHLGDKQDAVCVTRGRLLQCDTTLIDGNLLSPAYGGMFGHLDACAAYDAFHDMAVAHERASPQRPWVLIVHPFISGNRAWAGLERLLRRLHGQFGSSAFKTARAAVGLEN